MLAGALLLLRRRYRQLTGSARIAAFATLATLGLLAVHLLPAMLGVLARGAVLAAAALWLAAAASVKPVSAEPAPAPEPTRPGERIDWVLAAVGVGVLAAFALAVAIDQLTVTTPNSDALAFHLPGVAAWIDSGSIWQIDVYLADVSPGHYPNNGDVILLAAVLPWHNDFLAHFAIWPFWALTGVAVYALARELRVPAPASILAAAMILAIPAVSVPALVGNLVDALMLAGFATGVLFLVRHNRTGARSELVLAGLALGISFGTKWYGVSSVPVVVAVWALARYLGGRDLGRVLRQLAAVTGLIGLSGGVWLVRNWVESQNPVFPVEIAPLGITLFDAPPDTIREQFGFTIADYLGDADVWSTYLFPALRDALALPALLIGALAVLAAVLLVVLRGRGSGRPRTRTGEGRLVIAGLACAALLTLVYAITPYSAGGPEGMPFAAGPDSRYLVPALVVAAPLAAWSLSQRRWTTVFAAAALLAILHGTYLAASGRSGPLELSRGDVAKGAIAAALVALAAWALRRALPRLRRAVADPVGRLAAAGVAASVLIALAVAGDRVQERYNERRYLHRGDAAVDWVLTNARGGLRVGLAGVWASEGISPVLPAFGQRLDNEVSYVGRSDDDVLRRFDSRRGFAAALREGRYDVLIVGRGVPPQTAATPEQRWTRAAGFRLVVISDRLAVFEPAPPTER